MLKPEDIILNIIINGDKSRGEMNQLSKAIKEYTNEIKATERENKLLETQVQANNQEYQKNETQLKTLGSKHDRYIEKLKKLGDETDSNREAHRKATLAVGYTSDKIKELQQRQAELTTSTKTSSKTIVENKKKIAELNKERTIGINRIAEIRKTLKLEDLTISELTQKLKLLRREYVNAEPNSAKHKELAREIKTVTTRVNELNDRAGNAQSALAEMASKTQKAFAIAASIIASVAGLRKAYDAYTELDDKLADVIKTTGMTRDEVEILNDLLANIDTRTSQNELLGLAYQAGKLGETGVENVLKFTNAADKIGVALGDDLGGKEEAINTLGKLSKLFGDEESYGMGDSMLKIGSAINDLGMASAANEGEIVELMSRVSGVAVMANVASADVAGLAASFSALNQPAEATGTVLNKVMTGMFVNTAEYAKIAKMGITEFTALIQTDANEGLLRVLDGFKGQDLGGIANMLGEVGENGTRAAQAVSAIATNIDFVRTQQEVANKAFEDGTSIIAEFDTKNNTAQARREKAEKELTRNLVELGKLVEPIFTGMINGTAALTKALSLALRFLIDYKAPIIGLTTAVGLLTIATVAQDGRLKAWIATKASAIFMSKASRVAAIEEAMSMAAGTATIGTYTIAQKALIVVKALLAGSFTAAGVAAKAFFVSLGPIGWAVTAVSVLVGVLVGWMNKTEKSTEKLKEQSSETKQLVDNYKKLNDSYNNTVKIINPLIKRYEELKAKTRDSNEEQLEFKNVVSQIASVIPEAAVEFDEYGKVIDISTLALKNAMEAQRNYLISLKSDTVGKSVVTASNALKGMFKVKDDDLKPLEKSINSWNELMENGNRTLDANSQNIYNSRVKKLREEKEKYREYETILANHIYNLEQIGLTSTEIANKIARASGEAFNVDDLKKTMSVYRSVIAPTDNSWSLGTATGQEKLELQNKLYNKEIATKAEFDKKILELEISALDKRLKTNIEKGNERIAMQQQLAEKQYELQQLGQEIPGPSSSSDSPNKWSLDKDTEYGIARIALKKKLYNGEIATEEEHTKLVLALEIATLERRVAMEVEKGEEMLKLRDTLFDKQLQQDKATKAERQKILDLLDSGKSESERAEIEYRKQLIAYGLFTAEQLDDEQAYLERSQELNEEQYSALELLAARHRSKLSSIYNKSLADQVDKELKAITAEANGRQIRQERELGALQTLNQKKRFLVERFGVENLSAIRTEKDADQALTNQYARENEEIVRTSLQKQIQYYTAMMVSIKAMNPMGVAMNLEDIEKYKEIIAKLEEEFAKIKNPKPKGEESKADDKVDILGMTAKGWEDLFKNISDGKIGLEDIVAVAGAIGQAFSQVNALMTAMEQKEFKAFEKTQNKKKRSLETRLKSGAITQESYNTQVEQLDEKTDQKREEMERKQAERAKAAAVFQAIINTASGVVAALTLPAPASFIMAGIVAALGAVQIATILATPVPGAEDGGFVDVVRSQDGKKFRAKSEPSKRGFVDKPTVIVGENGSEYVVPADGAANKTILPILDIMESARRSGDIGRINMFDEIAQYQGRQKGGYVTSAPAPSLAPTTSFNDLLTSNGVTKEQGDVMIACLKVIAKRNLTVALTGNNGIEVVQAQRKSLRTKI